MGKREKYTVPLKCPTCECAGRADMSGAKSYKIESGYGKTIDAVPDGFDMAATTLRESEIICSNARVSAL